MPVVLSVNSGLNDTFKGCYWALLMMTTNRSLTKIMQKNIWWFIYLVMLNTYYLEFCNSRSKQHIFHLYHLLNSLSHNQSSFRTFSLSMLTIYLPSTYHHQWEYERIVWPLSTSFAYYVPFALDQWPQKLRGYRYSHPWKTGEYVPGLATMVRYWLPGNLQRVAQTVSDAKHPPVAHQCCRPEAVPCWTHFPTLSLIAQAKP